MKNFTLKLFYLAALLLPTSLIAQVPKLNSFPGATATIYIDFDGETVNAAYWNNGNTLVCAPAGLNAEEITEIFNRVSEDYRPFNVNITTDLAKFIAAPFNQRIRIIVTPTSAWRPGVGGVSYTGSFTWVDDTPGFVFSDRLGNIKFIAECVSHESGHTVGLTHQSRYNADCGLTETYNSGNGAGETGWAPVMGNSYNRNMTGWNDGPTPYGCANTQDNLTIITTQNGFTYRADDYTESMNETTTTLNASFSKEGIITTTVDKDAFRYDVSVTSTLHLDVTPYSVGTANSGANLDVQVQLFNGSNLVRTYNPGNSMSVKIDTSLNPGTYYFLVSGAGNDYASEYGSLGSYSLVGFRGALAIHDVSLNGVVNKTKHQLNWRVTADEPVKTQELEMSVDGRNFAPLSTINAARNSFEYTANQNGTLYYRLKITTVINQTAYSNVVALKSTEGAGKRFTVSTFVLQDVKVNASENFEYRLSDINGRTIASGKGTMGMNTLNHLNNQPSGMYVLQLVSSGAKQSERIIKQ
ncbi:MAG: T9SS type A sorting domain-containing protein [Chitinophagaceae bacterium]|nr:MAG: T9SS type A sorting domain-containing protein [Chitinophagaceae bacterium]